MPCDMCGKDDDLFLVAVEDSELSLCKGCSLHGKVVRRVRPKPVSQSVGVKKKILIPEVERVQILVQDYGVRIRQKREALGLTQKDFAARLTEKESLLHKIETGAFEPSILMARKFEHLLGIRLVEEVESSHAAHNRVSASQLTIGDLIKVNK